MTKKATFWGTLVGFGFLLGTLSGAVADTPEHSMDLMQPSQKVGQFQRIEQPLGNKVAVTVGGLGLIGLELWWFLFSQKMTATKDVQEVIISSQSHNHL
jgi:plastocyanin domain-containing protein